MIKINDDTSDMHSPGDFDLIIYLKIWDKYKGE